MIMGTHADISALIHEFVSSYDALLPRGVQ